MQQSSVTNTLLAVIAALQLVVVIQNASGSKSARSASVHSSNDSGMPRGDEMPPEHPPQDESAMPASDVANPHGGGAGFSPSSMILAALVCPSDATVTLGDPGCAGADAEKRKIAVEDIVSKGMPIPKIFDAVIEKFGEKALTAQAIEIRKARRK